jgi:hypothetical protein
LLGKKGKIKMLKMIKMNKKSSTVAELVSSVTGVNERGERVALSPRDICLTFHKKSDSGVTFKVTANGKLVDLWYRHIPKWHEAAKMIRLEKALSEACQKSVIICSMEENLLVELGIVREYQSLLGVEFTFKGELYNVGEEIRYSPAQDGFMGGGGGYSRHTCLLKGKYSPFVYGEQEVYGWDDLDSLEDEALMS